MSAKKLSLNGKGKRKLVCKLLHKIWFVHFKDKWYIEKQNKCFVTRIPQIGGERL